MPKIKQDHTKKMWTDPVLSPKNPTALDMKKQWRVRWEFFDIRTQAWVPQSRQNNINDQTNFKERLREANSLKSAIKFKLEKQGWNSITNTYAQPKESKDIDQLIAELKELNFSDALDLAYREKLPDWKGKTPLDFSSSITYYKLAAEELGIAAKKMRDLELPHFLFLLAKIQELNKLTNSGYNRYRSRLSSLLTKLANLHVVKSNCLRDAERKKTLKNNDHRPPTDKERNVIISVIKPKYPEYYTYLSHVYIGFRPKEVCNLKVRHFIRSEQLFRLDAIDSKTGKFREVPVPDWLLARLVQMNLSKYNPEHFLFSTRNKYGSFFPGPKRMHENTTNEWWKRIVKEPLDKGGLGLELNQYGIKKMGGDDMVKLQVRFGIDKILELPKKMMGHQSTDMTEVYVKEHHNVMKELIMRHMPEL